MNDKFNEMTKSLAQTVTRCRTGRRFGVSLIGMALAMLGLAAVFTAFEPTPASAKSVTSGDVRLQSERLVTQPSDSIAHGRLGRRTYSGPR